MEQPIGRSNQSGDTIDFADAHLCIPSTIYRKMNENEKGTLLYIAYVIFACALVTLPGFLFFYFKVKAGILVSALIGFIFAGFILTTIDLILAAFSIPGIMSKRMRKHRESALNNHNQQTK